MRGGIELWRAARGYQLSLPEDRTVKRFMRESANSDRLPRGLPLRAKEVQLLSRHKLRVVGKAIHPGVNEIAANPRARSAVMRVAERVNTT